MMKKNRKRRKGGNYEKTIEIEGDGRRKYERGRTKIKEKKKL